MSRPNTAAPADQPSPSTRRHTRLFAVITVAITVVLGLASVEWGLRWLGRSPDLDERLDAGLFTYHPKVGWALTPGWNGRHLTIDFDVRYSVNRSGHRGTTVEAVKPAGQRRIAYLGDSFTFATGVEDAETFTEVLNRADAPATVHLNFGLPGTSTESGRLSAASRLRQTLLRAAGWRTRAARGAGAAHAETGGGEGAKLRRRRKRQTAAAGAVDRTL
ncbi:MAG: hypothetical protein MUE49_12085 [Rhodospirillales bacterium]|nr:hypothetical protein [Rhodospirillales bacterium]